MAGYAAANIVDFVRGFGQRRKAAHVEEAMKNYIGRPEQAIQEVNQYDPNTAIALRDKNIADTAAQRAAQNALNDQNLARFKTVTSFLRGLPKDADVGAAYDSITPFLKGQMGLDDNAILEGRQAITANPSIITALDDEAHKASLKTNVVGPGAALAVGDQIVHQQPTAPKFMTVPDGKGGNTLVEVGGGAAPGPTSSPAPTAPGIFTRGSDIESHAYSLIPKVNVSSRYRPPGKNAEVKGVPDSYHLTDQARDFTPPAGMTMQGLYQTLKQGFPGMDVILEKDHVHVEPPKGTPHNGGAPVANSGGPRVLMTNPGQPKGVRAATAAELKAAGYPDGSAAQVDANGKFVNLKTPTAGRGGKGVGAPADLARRVQIITGGLTRLRQNAEEILADPALEQATGAIEGRLPSFRQASVDFDKKLGALKAQIQFGVLAEMRESSKTGGALGNVSNFEGERLSAALASLDTAQSAPAFKAALSKVIDYANQATKNVAAIGDASAEPIRRRNPKTGAVVEWNGRGWVPVRGQ